MTNSKKKGSRGELLWRNELRKAGFSTAYRTAQFSGNCPDGSPDVTCSELDFIHHEVKFVEKLNLQKAFDQAETDALKGQIPVVAHKKSRKNWLITLKASDWLKIIKEVRRKKNV